MDDGEPILPHEPPASAGDATPLNGSGDTLNGGINRRKVSALARKMLALDAKERSPDAPVAVPAPEPKAKPTRKPRVSKKTRTKAQPVTVEMGAPKVSITVITNGKGPIAKEFWLKEDDTLGKRSAAQVWEGTAEVKEAMGLEGVSKLIRELKSEQAVAYGRPKVGKAPLVALKRLRAADAPAGAIARTNDEFVFPIGKAGVFMGDYDPRPGYPPLDWNDLDAILNRVLPGFKGVQREWWPSSTFGIIRTDTGDVLQGPGGWRLRLVVDNAANIPAVGDYLFQALFAAGYGYCDVSKSGQVLIRTVLDGSVWQAARMDFAARPVLGKGLRRDAPEPVMISGAPVLDTTKLQPKMPMAKWRSDPDNEPLKKARAAVKGEAKRKRAAYLAEYERNLRAKGLTDEEVKVRTTALSRAMKEKVLAADAALLCSDGNTVVTVRDLLADPERWHQEHFADPLEPDYRDDHRIAIAYLLTDPGKSPVIHSFAHGGATYTLLPDPLPEPAEVPDARDPFEFQGCYMVVRRRVPGMPVPGVYFQVPVDETTETPPDPEWISTLVEPVAEARDEVNEKWGDRFEVVDGDGIRHLVTIGRDEGPMAGDGSAFRQALLRLGARFGTTLKARARLAEYIANWRPSRSVRSVSQTGWQGNTFLTQDRQYGGADEVAFQGRLRDGARMRVSGTHGGWKRNIAALCIGNSRLILGVSIALAGPVLSLLKVESGGVNIKVMAGQEVRILDIEANAKVGLGVFENLHECDTGKAFSDHLKAAADRDCGHAGRMFLEELVKDIPGYTQELGEACARFEEKYNPDSTGGQVARACTRFAVIAAAGELATKLGVTGWEEGDAEEAAARCFRDWLSKRPAGRGAAEDEQRIEQVRLFLALHGESRFATPWEKEVTHLLPNGETSSTVSAGRPTINRAGFREKAHDGGWTYYVDPTVWRTEVCAGTDPVKTAKVLIDRGWLQPGAGKNQSRTVRIPGEGDPRRFYTIKSNFMSESEPDKE